MGTALLPLPRAIRSRRPSTRPPSPHICSRCTCSALSSSCTTRGWNYTRRCARLIDSSRMQRWMQHQSLRRSRSQLNSSRSCALKIVQKSSNCHSSICSRIHCRAISTLTTPSAHAVIERIKQSTVINLQKCQSFCMLCDRADRPLTKVCAAAHARKKNEKPRWKFRSTSSENNPRGRESGRPMSASSLRRHRPCV